MHGMGLNDESDISIAVMIAKLDSPIVSVEVIGLHTCAVTLIVHPVNPISQVCE